jgi:hypothetical protein
MAGSRAHAGVGTLSHGSFKGSAVYQWPIVTQTAGRIPELAEALLGSTSVGPWILCAAVGAVDEETINAYIENQKWEEDDQGFKITAPSEP